LTFTFVNSLERAVMLAKAAAGAKSVTLLGASIDQQCLNAGLVDEIMIHLAPVLIGEGKRLFDHLRAGDIELEPALSYHQVTRPETARLAQGGRTSSQNLITSL